MIPALAHIPLGPALAAKNLADGRRATIHPVKDRDGIQAVLRVAGRALFGYRSGAEAFDAFDRWDGTSEPEGWDVDAAEQRVRVDGRIVRPHD
jgi:hypothetical protein